VLEQAVSPNSAMSGVVKSNRREVLVLENR
jgi:hypothetical protein